jgi:NDP-hexose 4-ketoreductase
VTKLAATQLVVGAVAAGLLEAVVLRVFNPIGPGTPEASVLGRVAEQVRRAMASGSARVTTGPLGAFRDFVDVRDVAAAVRAATLSRDVTEPVVNIGSGTAQSIRDTVARLAAVARFEGVVEESDVTPARSAGVEWIAADTTLAGHQLGWAPRYSLEESLEGIWSP